MVTLCRGGGAMNQPNFIADVLLTYSLSPSKPWLDVNDSQAGEREVRGNYKNATQVLHKLLANQTTVT